MSVQVCMLGACGGKFLGAQPCRITPLRTPFAPPWSRERVRWLCCWLGGALVPPLGGGGEHMGVLCPGQAVPPPPFFPFPSSPAPRSIPLHLSLPLLPLFLPPPPPSLPPSSFPPLPTTPLLLPTGHPQMTAINGASDGGLGGWG